MHIDITEACRRLKDGDVVAIPTDTVYGLAIDPRQPAAVETLFHLKGRPESKPLIALVATPEQVISSLEELPPGFYPLVQAFWPGALTLVLPVSEQVIPATIRAGLPTAGFRVPAHPVALQLLQEYGVVVATSANRSSEPPATTSEQVEAAFGKDLPLLDGEGYVHGIPSTIVAWQDERWQVLREGAIKSEELSASLLVRPTSC